VRGFRDVQCLAVVVASVTVVTCLLLCGCGGGGGSAPSVTSPRGDGQVGLSAQTIKLVTDAGSATSRTLSTPAVLALPGKDFLLPVSVSDLANVAGAAVRLEFDPTVLSCSDIELGKSWPGSLQTAKNTAGKPGLAAVALAGTTEAPAGAGVIATFHLRVLPSAAPQNASLKVNAVLVDGKGQALGRSNPLPAGTVRPRGTSTLIGDLMGTGSAEVGSAIKILRVVVKLDSAPPAADLWQWDCNKSGDIDVGDAIKILRCVVQLDPWPIAAGLGRIAFVSGDFPDTGFPPYPNTDIYVMNMDGSGRTRLTNAPALDVGPSWSPDGEKIAFESDRAGGDYGWKIYVMNADGSGQTFLHVGSAPAWSPDGKKIAFDLLDGNYAECLEIYVMDADGSGQTRLTNNVAIDENPSWSPDGKKIAFQSNRGGNTDVYVMNADGSGQTRLTSHWAGDMHPSWSPDGKKIAFDSLRDGTGYEIYVMNADGSGQTRLTNNPAADWGPVWLPDGKKIAFSSDRDGYGEIYVMNADGSEQTNLTNSGLGSGDPAFCPVP